MYAVYNIDHVHHLLNKYEKYIFAYNIDKNMYTNTIISSLKKNYHFQFNSIVFIVFICSLRPSTIESTQN